MQKGEGLKVLFIINPVSGGKEKNNWEAAIREYFRDKPHRMEFYLLTGQDDKRSVMHHIDLFKPDRVVAVGGDGTVKMVAGILKETPLVLGILPAGSANGMATELGLPVNMEEALDVVIHGSIKKIDLLRINEEQICIHLCDVGLNAMLVKYFEQSKKRGMWSYGKAVFRVLWQKQKMRVSIQTESASYQRKAYMVVMANARKYGTGANINPEGDIADGRFEIVILRKLNVLEILKAIFTDRSFHPKRIEVIPATEAEIRIHRKAYFQVDGEFEGKTALVKARVLAGVLHVVVPAQTA